MLLVSLLDLWVKEKETRKSKKKSWVGSLWVNRLAQSPWNSRDGAEGKLKQRENEKKKDKNEAIMREETSRWVILAGGREKQKMEKLFHALSLHFDRGSSVTCTDNDCTSLRVLKHCSLLFFFHYLILNVPNFFVLLSLFSFFCKQKPYSDETAGQLVSILTGHHLDIRGIKTFRNGISANDFIR